MKPDTLRPAIETARDAVHNLLANLLGDEPTLSTGDPAETQAPEPLAFALVARPKGARPFAVVLGEGWSDALSQAMLGEPVAPTEATDLLQEVAAQGLGAVRTALASAGLEVPEAPLLHADSLEDLARPLWRVPFTLAHADRTLEGAVYLPPVALPTPEKPAAPKPPTAEGPPPPSPEVARPTFQELGPERLDAGDGAQGNLALLADVELEVTVELGRRRLPLADVLRLTTGSVIELENLVGQPLEVYANGRLIAEGEAVVIDEQFGVRITSLVAQRKRQRSFL